MIRLGLQIPNFTYPGVADTALFERVAAIATTAESAGFDSVWVMDHFYQIPGVGPRTDPMLEAYTLLGAIAARTSRVSLGAMVTGVTYRNPALLAKIVTTLDVISSGRAILARHCEELGRDPSTITKTRLGGLVIAPTGREAERVAREAAARRETDLEEYRGYA